MTLAGGTLQAGWSSGLRARLCLSGVTPGERVELTVRRKTDAAPCAVLVVQGKTRWGVPADSSMRKTSLARVLAATLVAGEPAVDQITARLTHTFGRSWDWLRPLARRYVKFLGNHARPHRRDVIRFLIHDLGFRRVRSTDRKILQVKNWLIEAPRMQPVPAAVSWPVPPIESVGELATWLGLEVSDLLWLADVRGLAHKQSRPLLRNYHFRILPKPTGHIRLIEIPKPRLKELQRQFSPASWRRFLRIPPYMASSRAGPSKHSLHPMWASKSSCAWTCKISFRRLRPHGSRPSSEPPDILRLSPTC